MPKWAQCTTGEATAPGILGLVIIEHSLREQRTARATASHGAGSALTARSSRLYLDDANSPDPPPGIRPLGMSDPRLPQAVARRPLALPQPCDGEARRADFLDVVVGHLVDRHQDAPMRTPIPTSSATEIIGAQIAPTTRWGRCLHAHHHSVSIFSCDIPRFRAVATTSEDDASRQFVRGWFRRIVVSSPPHHGTTKPGERWGLSTTVYGGGRYDSTR